MPKLDLSRFEAPKPVATSPRFGCRACGDRGLIPAGPVPESYPAPDIFRLFVPCTAAGCVEGARWQREFDIEFGVLKLEVPTAEEWRAAGRPTGDEWRARRAG